jgi:hypothetical protein
MRSLFGLIVFIALVWTGIVAYEKLISRGDDLASRREEFQSAVRLAGTPMALTPRPTKQDFDDVVASRSAALYERRNQEFSNPELTRMWAQIETQTDRNLVLLRKIAQVKQNTPSFTDILNKALQDDSQQKDQELLNSILAGGNGYLAYINLEGKLRREEAALDDAVGDLQQVAGSLYPDPGGEIYSVRYWPSWGGRYWGDQISVTNQSGESPRNEAVFVTIHMKDGSQRAHAHYIDDFSSGATLSALYRYDAYEDTASASGDLPSSVDVAVYQGTSTARATYVLTPEAWDEIVKEYCSRLTFTGTFLGPYVEDVTGNRYDAGYKFQFQGLSSLPVTSIRLKFISASGDVQSADFPIEDGEIKSGGDPVAMRSPLLDGDPPAQIKYTLTFSGTSYEHTVPAQ